MTPINIEGSTLIGTMLTNDRPGVAVILTKSGVTHRWDLTDTEGLILDADISLGRASVYETTTPKGEPGKALRIHEIIPWHEIANIVFEYDSVPMPPGNVN